MSGWLGYLLAGASGGVVGAALTIGVVWYASVREARYLEDQAKDRALAPAPLLPLAVSAVLFAAGILLALAARPGDGGLSRRALLAYLLAGAGAGFLLAALARMRPRLGAHHRV